MSYLSFIASTAIVLIFIEIRAQNGFSIEIFLGLCISLGKLVSELVRALFKG